MKLLQKSDQRLLLLSGFTFLILFPVLTAQAENWTRFRGDNGSGISTQKGIPETWSPADYDWNIELPGVGHAPPAIWGDKLFVTSALGTGAKGGKFRYLYCLDAKTGKQIWARMIGLNESHRHLKSSWASSTPAVDGERVYVAFADQEQFLLAAYDFDGTLIWRRILGPFESQHGLGVSPIVFEELVIIPNEQDGPSSIIAVDRRTGKTVWSALRKTQIQGTSYATPIIVKSKDGSPQLICSSRTMGVTSLDPYTGTLNWNSGELPARTVASPAYGNGLIIQTCGGGGKGMFMVAVDPSGKGDVSQTHVKYTRDKLLPYVPTPVAYNGYLFLWTDQGVVNCVEIETGKTVWANKRAGGSISGSPICVDGKLYAICENGDVVVIAASPNYHFFGKTSLGDASYSTPSVANGRIYFRTFHRLICLPARN